MFVKAEGYQSILKLSCGPLAFAPCRAFFGGAEGCLGLQSWAGGLGRVGGRWGWAWRGEVDIYFSVFFCCCWPGLVCVCVCVLGRGGEGGWLCVHSDLRFS